MCTYDIRPNGDAGLEALRPKTHVPTHSDLCPNCIRPVQVQSNAAGALHNLAVNDEEAQEAVALAGAIPPLISLMQNASPDLQAKAAATIWSIAGREDNRKRIMDAGGIAPLVPAHSCPRQGCWRGCNRGGTHARNGRVTGARLTGTPVAGQDDSDQPPGLSIQGLGRNPLFDHVGLHSRRL